MVVRYKSAGDMLAECESASNKHASQQDDDDDSWIWDSVRALAEPEVSARCVMPLLAKSRSRTRCARRAKWHSCKLLGHHWTPTHASSGPQCRTRGYTHCDHYDHDDQHRDDDDDDQYQDDNYSIYYDAPDTQAELDKCTHHSVTVGQQQSKSAADFVALDMAAAKHDLDAACDDKPQPVAADASADCIVGPAAPIGGRKLAERRRNKRLALAGHRLAKTPATSLSVSSPALAQQHSRRRQQVQLTAAEWHDTAAPQQQHQLDANLRGPPETVQTHQQQPRLDANSARLKDAAAPVASADVTVAHGHQHGAGGARCCVDAELRPEPPHQPAPQSPPASHYNEPTQLPAEPLDHTIGLHHQQLHLAAPRRPSVSRASQQLEPDTAQRKSALPVSECLGGTAAVPVSWRDTTQAQASSTTPAPQPEPTTGKLMIGTDSHSARLAPCPWRYRTHTGSYKVARQHQQPFVRSASESEAHQHQLQLALHHSPEVGDTLAAQGHSGEQQLGDNSSDTGGRRVARPGRSPVSLARHTNARLLRHRLKIQQRRQEQLANLALKERQQLGTATHSHRYYSTPIRSQLVAHNPSQAFNRQPVLIDIEHSRHGAQQQATTTTASPGSIVKRILATVWPTRQSVDVCGQPAAGQPATRNNIATSDNSARQSCIVAIDSAARHTQQRQVIRRPTTTSADAIEICDNQIACSSSGPRRASERINNKHRFSATGEYCVSAHVTLRTEPHVLMPPTHRRRLATNSMRTGNVIVYRSVDMLRNAASYGCQMGPKAHGAHSSAQPTPHHNANDTNTRHSDEDSDDTNTICSSASSMSLNRPFCKICHLGTSKGGDKLISPCKCAGTMRYIHCGCLLKWLEISNRTNEKPMSCELCAHEYTWHKKFNYNQLQMPKCSLKDVFLHLTFVAAIALMFFCALAPILLKKQPDPAPSSDIAAAGLDVAAKHHQVAPNLRHNALAGYSNHLTANSKLAHDEKFLLMCAAFFFVSFFLAIYVQTKARDTLYGLFVKFITMNQTYYITEYDHGHTADSNNSASATNAKHQHNNQILHHQQDQLEPYCQQQHQQQVKSSAQKS